MFIPHRIQRLSIVHVSRDPLNVPSKILRDQASRVDHPSYLLPFTRSNETRCWRRRRRRAYQRPVGGSRTCDLCLLQCWYHLYLIPDWNRERPFWVFAFHVIEACIEARGFVGTLRN